MAAHPQRDGDDMMLVDEEYDVDGDDQLIDDDDVVGQTRASPPSEAHYPERSLQDSKQSNTRRRRPLESSQASSSIDKSIRKREQREREKEQQKQLLAKLIEIFETGGGTCAVQQGQKKFPWVDLPAALIRIGCYFAGWPEKCLPKMSDKHPDRIDASTGPSQWSLKQKRAMEAQINKGAVKVLPRPDNRAVIFEIVDDFGNVKDSTVEFSENWVRNKLLGLGVVANSPVPIPHPHPPAHVGYPSEPRQLSSSAMATDIDYSPPQQQHNTLALPPIRSNVDYNERLELPSLSQMTSMNGLHTPEDDSRSPSPMSNLSDGRFHPGSLHLHPSMRQASYHHPSKYPASYSQDDLLHTRGRILSLEHGLPRNTSSLRSTSRHRPTHPHHHHPYSQTMSTSSVSSMRSRPPSPYSSHAYPQSHSRSHSGVVPSLALLTDSPEFTSANTPTRKNHSNGSSPSMTGPASAGAGQRLPSHVPNVPSSVVAWDAQSRGWVLKVQSDRGFRSLPCLAGGVVCWHKDADEWECRSSQPEAGRALWNRHTASWELYPVSEAETREFMASPHLASQAVYPTHLPDLEGTCVFDAERLQSWVFSTTPESESRLPLSPCIIVWSVRRKQWSLLSETPQDVDVTWSQKDHAWHFSMPTTTAKPRRHSRDHSASPTSPRPSSAPHSNTLPPMIIRATSPIQSPPRSSAPRPLSTASSSF
ncbi:hypothetical protein M408DRAFT_9233 [Serendipita vermifera MAFF 305830]|uniref:Uncharacterized protein n=1 Tax=Serendipita vermifera MAFF 305830 TaxID=933852 RepID=A0A0C3B5P3_SERVB|nr:hypothetical protein M408DRAFT_9233 [Serendipita vermifera MAFF 305830]